MDKQEARQWVETGKMFNKIKDKGIDVVYNLKNDTFDEIKQVYFSKVLGIDDTVIEEFEFTEDVLDKLYQMADAQDKIIDEVICDILNEYINRQPKNYKLLNVGDLIEDGDEIFVTGFYQLTGKWVKFYNSMFGERVLEGLPVRRLIK